MHYFNEIRRVPAGYFVSSVGLVDGRERWTAGTIVYGDDEGDGEEILALLPFPANAERGPERRIKTYDTPFAAIAAIESRRKTIAEGRRPDPRLLEK